MEIYSEFSISLLNIAHPFHESVGTDFYYKIRKLIIQIESTNKRTHAAQMLPRERIYKIFEMIRVAKKYALSHNALSQWIDRVVFRAFVTKQTIKWTQQTSARSHPTNNKNINTNTRSLLENCTQPKCLFCSSLLPLKTFRTTEHNHQHIFGLEIMQTRVSYKMERLSLLYCVVTERSVVVVFFSSFI